MKPIAIIKKVYIVQGFYSFLLSELWSGNYSTAWQPFSYESTKHEKNAEYQVESTWKLLLPQFVSTLTNTV